MLRDQAMGVAITIVIVIDAIVIVIVILILVIVIVFIFVIIVINVIVVVIVIVIMKGATEQLFDKPEHYKEKEGIGILQPVFFSNSHGMYMKMIFGYSVQNYPRLLGDHTSPKTKPWKKKE